MSKEVQNQETRLSNVKALPNLRQAEISQRELSSEYWTPENEGEFKVGVLLEITEEDYVNKETGETVKLPCVIMLSQNEDLTFSTIRNGSKRLVATIEKAIEKGDLVMELTPVRVTYIGNQKNKTNAFKSDRWSVKQINI